MFYFLGHGATLKVPVWRKCSALVLQVASLLDLHYILPTL